MSKLVHFGVRASSALVLLCAFTAFARGEEGAWLTDFEAAKAKAKAEKKLLLVDFTGSDWCIWCKKLRSEVFEKEPFTTEAPKQFVMVELDFPNEKKLPVELKAQNDKLSKQYKIHGFPTVLLVNPDGEVVARTGYRFGGPEKYVANLAKLLKLHDGVSQIEAELASAKELDRAKLLDRMVDDSSQLDIHTDEIKGWTAEIIDLDKDNKLGLKSKNEVRQMLAEAEDAIHPKRPDDAKKAVMVKPKPEVAQKITEEILAREGLLAEQKQDALSMQAMLLRMKMDIRGALVLMKKALEADTNSPNVDEVNSTIESLEKAVAFEDAAIKAKAELDKAEGSDRLKLLDQTIDAYGKAANRIEGKDQTADVQAWKKEIIKLDADNKAGLKGKYEFDYLLSESQKMLAAHKNSDALAMVDQALALKEIKPEQAGQAMYLKCTLLLRQKDYQGAIVCAKKAEPNAKGMMAKVFKSIIDRAEKELAKSNGGESKPTDGNKAL